MSRNSSAPVGMSGVMHVLERRILRPAIYLILVGGFVRVGAVSFNSTFPYTSWPLIVQLAIDATVALGTVGVSDIMYNIACSRARLYSAEMDALSNSEEYRPNPAWNPRKFAQQSEVLKAKLESALKAKRRQRNEQIAIAGLCGFIMLVFGAAFEAITFNRVSLLGAAIGFITAFALLPLQYAVFAVYREIRPSIHERAEQIVDEATEAALEEAREAFRTGTATQPQMDLLNQATTNQFHRGMIRVMRKRDTTQPYLTQPEVYAYYGITDASGQAQIRKRIADAGEKGIKTLPEQCQVMKDPATDKWITPVSALGALFPQEFIDRIRANAARKNSAPQAAPAPVFSEQASSNDQTVAEQSAPAPALVLALDTSHASPQRTRRRAEPDITTYLARAFRDGLKLEEEEKHKQQRTQDA